MQPETGMHFKETHLEPMLEKIRVHREYKGLPIDSILEDVERQICASLTTDWCDPDPGEQHVPVTNRTSGLTFDMALSLQKALVGFLASGCSFVSREESSRRAAICRGCPYNVPSSGCTCQRAYRVVEVLIPAERHQEGISVCSACGCSLQAKVNLPMDVIQKSNSEAVVFPKWCWQLPPLEP